VQDRRSLRKTDLIHAPQLRRRPTRYANTLPTVLLRTYGPTLLHATVISHLPRTPSFASGRQSD